MPSTLTPSGRGLLRSVERCLVPRAHLLHRRLYASCFVLLTFTVRRVES
jgi:hypothetical protein